MPFASSDHRNRQRSWRLWARGLLFVALLCPWMLRGQGTGSPVSSKLTTVLADLARAVPQDFGPATDRVAPTAPMESAKPLDREALPKSVRDALKGRLLRMNSRDEVQVYILMLVTDANLSRLKSSGVTIEITDAAHRRVQARIPVSRLQAVADLPFLNFVRLPSYGVQLTGSVDSEGDAILLASQARQQLGLDGTGVRVGVISDGLKGVFATSCTTCQGASGGPISTGDLPNATGTRNSAGVLISSSGGITGTAFVSGNETPDLEDIHTCPGFAGAGAEGTALLEIVHDIAPGAQLSFANFSSGMDFESAINFLASSNDVVVDDIGFLGEPDDGTGPISTNTAAALNSQSNPIRGYFTSAGNFAIGHYYGLYADSSVNGNTISGVSNSGDLHLFQQADDTSVVPPLVTTDILGLGPEPYNVIQLPSGAEVVIFLTWDDPFGASANNYDLYLVQQTTGKVMASSTDAQNGSQDPVEAIDYTNNTGAQDFFHIVVQNVSNRAQAQHLNIFTFEPECATAGPSPLAPPGHERHNFNTSTRSLAAQSDAGGSPVSVTTVGAICSASTKASTTRPTDASCADTTNSTIEYFSSQGPTLDGRLKPEISGIDGVSITGAGQFENPFFGTSAAAPHLAGIAALVLQAAPCLLNGATGAVSNSTARADLRSLILNNAAPLQDSSGDIPNQTFGYGRADALASAEQTLPVYGGPSTLTISGTTPSGASVTAAQLGFSDPHTCPLSTLNWSGGCGSGPGSTMNCPFGQNNVSVMASNNGVSFSPAANVQIVVTNFSVGVAPTAAGSGTVKAGQSANYTVTVSPQRGAFSNAITLACSGSTLLPAGTSCSFNPAVVTPGSSPAQSTLTISTTGSAAAPPVDSTRWDLLRRWSPLASRPGAIPVALWLGVAALILLGCALARWSVRWRAGPARLASVGRFATLVAASFALALIALQLSCGGSGSSGPPPPPPSTPAGNYSIGITGTSGTLVQSSTATLVVQ